MMAVVSRTFPRWLLAWLAVASFPVQAAWLSVCPGNPPATEGAFYRQRYLNPDGTAKLLLFGADKPPACPGVRLPLGRGDVLWAGLIPREAAQVLGGGVILQGVERDGRFQVSEVIPLGAARHAPRERKQAPPELPEGLRANAFGREERASIRLGAKGWVLQCGDGALPAGALLRGELPHPPRGVGRVLRVGYRGAGRFGLGVSDAARASREDPLPLGQLNAGSRLAWRDFALPDALMRQGGLQWTLSCPQQAARLELQFLRLVAKRARPPGRAMWAWRPGLWLDSPGRLLDGLQDAGAKRVYVSVPMADGRLPDKRVHALQAFVAAAGRRGIEVWAVEGDPRAVLPAERRAYVARAQEYAAYNRAAPEASRLRGLQYDIEPYLIPGYTLATADWLRAYLDTVARLKAALDMPMEVVVPFWWARQRLGGALLLDRLAPYVDGVVVMDYRTDPIQIRRFARPFLAWGARAGRRVRIALEAGPIADEQRRYYRGAGSGQVWHVRMGEDDALLLLTAAKKNPRGPSLAAFRDGVLSGSRISFHRDKQALLRLLPELEAEWAQWPSFSGVALHEWGLP